MAEEERPVYQQMWSNLEFLREHTDVQYVIDVLETRREYLRLRRREEMEVRRIYVAAAAEVAKRLRNLKPTIGDLTRSYLMQLERSLSREAETIRQALTQTVRDSITSGIELGARAVDRQLLRAIEQADVSAVSIARVQRGFADVNKEAVEALWARTQNGLRVSDRIWRTSQSARNAMRDLIQVGVAAGRDTVAIARDLERYVQSGVGTLSKNYPNMMARMGKRIPKDLGYEALRLVRTEKAKAYTEGTYSRGNINPSYQGVKWVLSDSHPVFDICDTLATQDVFKMGPGVYPKGQEPVIPHPNCLCQVLPVLDDTEDFVDRLIAWKNDPSSQPDLEAWYQEIYLQLPAA